MRSIFGWSLPPGVTNSMIERAYGGEGPCDVCGKVLDDCICPECPVCTSAGDPQCYEQHGMDRTCEQIASFEAMDAARRAEIEQENAMWADKPDPEDVGL